jgi:hypothetical protein
MRAFNAIRRIAGPNFGREVVHEAAEDQFREWTGLKPGYTGLPTRGAAAFTVVKKAFGSLREQPKLHVVDQLQTRGISPEGAKAITAGKTPKLQADLQMMMLALDPARAGNISIAAVPHAGPASPAAGPIPTGEILTAAMLGGEE